MTDLEVPKFATESEEAAWWEANEATFAEEFEKATAEGGVSYGTVVITGSSSVTRVLLGPEEVAWACAQAAERGLRCQTYLKMIIHEALRDAEQKRKAS